MPATVSTTPSRDPPDSVVVPVREVEVPVGADRAVLRQVERRTERRQAVAIESRYPFPASVECTSRRRERRHRREASASDRPRASGAHHRSAKDLPSCCLLTRSRSPRRTPRDAPRSAILRHRAEWRTAGFHSGAVGPTICRSVPRALSNSADGSVGIQLQRLGSPRRDPRGNGCAAHHELRPARFTRAGIQSGRGSSISRSVTSRRLRPSLASGGGALPLGLPR